MKGGHAKHRPPYTSKPSNDNLRDTVQTPVQRVTDNPQAGSPHLSWSPLSRRLHFLEALLI